MELWQVYIFLAGGASKALAGSTPRGSVINDFGKNDVYVMAKLVNMTSHIAINFFIVLGRNKCKESFHMNLASKKI